MNKKISTGRVRIVLRTSLVAGVAVAGLALGSLSHLGVQGESTRKSTDAPAMSRGKMCNDLFIAIDHRDTAGVKALLEKGADPNSRNGLDFTPIYLAAASHQPEVVDLLLKAGAKSDATSIYGTPLSFACVTGNAVDGKKFLDMGANASFQRGDGMTPLMDAAYSGSVEMTQALIDHKVDVNLKDDGGETALSLAARGGALEVGKLLIAAGADVNNKNEEGLTPLMTASMNGHADFAKLLLDNGAKPNATDANGRTALVLTANYADYPDVVKTLVAAKASTSAKDMKGRTAASLAVARGFNNTAMILAGKPAMTRASRTPREAVGKSLKLIQASMRGFSEGASCISCHQEGLGRMATGEAQSRGFRLDADVQKMQMGRINGMLGALKPLHEGALKNPEVMKSLPLIEINEVTPIDAWLLSGMAANGTAPTPASQVMAMVLAKQQSPNGAWTFSLPRIPMQSSFITFTALSVNALNHYAPKSDAMEVKKRIGDARTFLMSAKPMTSEDRASKLLGLKWSGADAASRKAAVDAILKDQQPDGGWSQVPGMRSDAYATGQALYALRVGGGMSITDSAYKRGQSYLLRTQDDDGSWFVSKRAMPANNYYDGGFPHGESQYSSFNGTCWATLALLPAAAPKK